MGAFRLAKMQLAQASAFAVGEGDLRDVEDDPVMAMYWKVPSNFIARILFEAEGGDSLQRTHWIQSISACWITSPHETLMQSRW
ncbi:hypothetical protein AXG94_15730 [Pseudomonas corrugata]|nr:hypothetical protein AXG94_15730 [Pseudomonas corrugata]